MYQLVVRMGERPERPPANAPLPISDRDWSIVESAWHADPDARPLFTQITARLNARTAGGLIPEASGLLFHNGQRTGSVTHPSNRFTITNSLSPHSVTLVRPSTTGGSTDVSLFVQRPAHSSGTRGQHPAFEHPAYFSRPSCTSGVCTQRRHHDFQAIRIHSSTPEI